MKKIQINDNYYCIAIPGEGNYYEFWLFKSDYGIATMMFGCEVESDEDITDLVESNADQYIEDFEEMCEQYE